jgi:hypothetical protein
VITDEELARLENIALPEFSSRKLSCLFKASERGAGLRSALDRLCAEAERAVRSGVNILILSDRGVSPDLAPIPMLLATGAVHHHLVRETLRTRCGIVCETGDAREVSHLALLIGYGAAAVNPYLALQTVDELAREGTYTPEDLDPETASTTTSRRATRGCSRRSRRWGSRRCSRTAARRSSKRSGSTGSWSSAASRERRRASPASATT